MLIPDGKWRLKVLFRTGFLAATLFVGGIFTQSAGATDAPRAVVELFTSQGCSSCPPADRILADYAKSGDVLALSWHVDYWNYLGWKDTFSHSEFTKRQKLYAAAFRRRGVYTPQAVVNGRDHVVGSHRKEIENLVDRYHRGGKGLSVPVAITRDGDQVRVFTAEGANAGKATLWIIYFDRKREVVIQRGENRGRTIAYHNVVRESSMLGMAKHGAVDVTLPMKELKRKGYEACALVLQQTIHNGLPGPIVGATIIDNLQDR